MKTEAITQARQKLEKAREALNRLEATEDAVAVEEAWIDFLIPASSVYQKLRAGVQADPKSRQWMGEKNVERTADPLLSYVQQARNADEHGIERVTKASNSHVTLAPGSWATFRKGPQNSWDIVAMSPGAITEPLDRAALAPVTDRTGKTDAPPLSHLGQPVTDVSPRAVAKLALAYLEQLVADAEALV